MLDKFAQELKAEREKSNINLNQVAIKTRIDLKFLQSMENGDFSFLPDLYIRAFIKEYAMVVGLDPEKTLLKYEAARAGKKFEPEEEKQAPEIKPDEQPVTAPVPPANTSKLKSFDATVPAQKQSADSAAEKKKRLILLGVILVAIAIVVTVLIVTSDEPKIIVREKPIEDIIEENKKYYEEPVKKEESEGIVPLTGEGDSLDLTIKTTDTVWVKAIIDNSVVSEFILYPNSSRSVKAAGNFKLTFGNSKAVQLLLNNNSLDFQPKTSPVSHIKVDASGLSYLNSPPTTGQE